MVGQFLSVLSRLSLSSSPWLGDSVNVTTEIKTSRLALIIFGDVGVDTIPVCMWYRYAIDKKYNLSSVGIAINLFLRRKLFRFYPRRTSYCI